MSQNHADPTDRGPSGDDRLAAAIAAWRSPDDCPPLADAVIERWRAERTAGASIRPAPSDRTRPRRIAAAALLTAASLLVAGVWWVRPGAGGDGDRVAERRTPPAAVTAPESAVEPGPDEPAVRPSAILAEGGAVRPAGRTVTDVGVSTGAAAEEPGPAVAWLDRHSERLARVWEAVLDPPRPDPWETLRWGVQPYRTGLSDAVHFVNDALPGEPRAL